MTIPGAGTQFFPTSAELQDFLLTQPPGGLVIVPHMRLAHQVWRRQRQAARESGLAAWEPAAMTTLAGWWQQLWGRLWLPVRPASTMERLLVWLEAMESVPPLAAVKADLSWAAALDEAHDLCQRYQMPQPADSESSPLIAWRLAVTQQFAALMTERGLITPAAISGYLLEALSQGKIRLPEQLVVVGLETPAPLEVQWLEAVARQIPVVQVRLSGPQEGQVSQRGVALPDRRQEMEWVAAQVLELAHGRGVPLHRLAITSPNLEAYLPDLRRIWRELAGEAETGTGGRYNFSLGPTLAETPLFQAALLPLTFILGGEPRQDLTAWLQSPYYQASQRHRKIFLQWDRAWRQAGVAYDWGELRQVASVITPHPDPLPSRGEGKKEESSRGEGEEEASREVGMNKGASLAALIDRALALLPEKPAPAPEWRGGLLDLWRLLGFPLGTEPETAGQWQALQNLLAEWAGASGERLWTAGDLVEWLSWGAGRLEQPGEGSSEAGVQIQGLLELRGLDFEAVFCLGLNMGIFPPPPRQLPLLTGQEKAMVLGGDYDSQGKFAETSYTYLLASAPSLILTRPLVDQDEERLASPVISPIWENNKENPVKFSALGQPHPAWLRSPAVSAAFRPPDPGLLADQDEPITMPLPAEISLSALETALTCPCKFYLSVLLRLEELPEIEPGLPALERGSAVHEVLQLFTGRFGEFLENTDVWDDEAAQRHLLEVVEAFRHREQNPHWQAEIDRWLEEPGGVLRHWLGMEKQRFQAGWRWLAMEESFSGLQLQGWPTRIRGRLDRVDVHASEGLMLWDYKTGAVPGKTDITEERSRFQLFGYLLAVQQGLTMAPPHSEARAGIIGLKSSREEHLRFEDYRLTAADWRKITEAKLDEVARFGSRVGEGDYRPDPSQPPPARNNSCRFCPYSLLCGHGGAGGGDMDA